MTKSMIKKLEAMKAKLMADNKAQISTVGAMYGLVVVVILLFIIAILYTFLPGIGGVVATSTPAAPATGAGSEWNSSIAANNIPTGASIWTSASGMVKIVTIILLLGMVVVALLGMLAIRRMRGGEGGGM